MSYVINSKIVNALVGENIKNIRETSEPSATQGQLAEILSVSRASIANYESGNQSVDLTTLYKIADHFEMDIFDIIPSLADVKLKTSPEMQVDKDENLSKDARLEIKRFIKNISHEE